VTLKEIKAMFQVGQQWAGENTYAPKASGPREVVQLLSTQMVWKTPHADRSWMQFPKAAQVIEARDGFLKFKLFSDEENLKYRGPGAAQATLTLVRQ